MSTARTTPSDVLLRNACPLTHPMDFRVRVRDQVVPLYRDGGLIVNGDTWAVPHDWRDSVDARKALLLELENDYDRRRQWMWAMSRRTPQAYLLWLNWFAWTFVQKEIGPDGKESALSGNDCYRPFASWPCQDRAATELFAAINEGFDVTVDKSRQMGATWLICSMFLWFVLFQPNVHFAALSRIEELVDNPGDPQAIFWKIDFMIRNLPSWMKGGIHRTRLKLVSLSTGSSIMGRSTTGEQGRGGAVLAAFFDEASQIDVLEALWTSFGQSTTCRIANSTPYGAGYFSKLVRSPAVHKIRLPWYEHPLKGAGRHTEKDPNNGELCIVSPFYEAQCRRESPDPNNWWLGRKTRGVSQELDMDHTGSGRLVFDYSVVARQISLAREPSARGEIRFRCGKLERVRAVRDGDASKIEFVEDEPGGRGKWEFWIDLEEDEDGNLRPDQGKTYVLAQDIAQGVGASESTLAAFCVETREKVAQYRNAHIAPIPFALLCCAAGWWFGGPKGFAFLIWEANGYGQAFGRTVVKLRYPWIYCHTDESGRTPKTGQRVGWHSSGGLGGSKLREYEALRGAMAAGDFNDPSRASLEQMLEIVHYEGGGIGPAILEVQSDQARSLHADLVTANVLAWYGATKRAISRPKEAEPPAGSPAWRRKYKDQIVRNAPFEGSVPRSPLARPNPFNPRGR